MVYEEREKNIKNTHYRLVLFSRGSQCMFYYIRTANSLKKKTKKKRNIADIASECVRVFVPIRLLVRNFPLSFSNSHRTEALIHVQQKKSYL